MVQKIGKEGEEWLVQPAPSPPVATEMEGRQLEGLPERREILLEWDPERQRLPPAPAASQPAEALPWQLQEDGRRFQKSCEFRGCWEFLRLLRKRRKTWSRSPLVAARRQHRQLCLPRPQRSEPGREGSPWRPTFRQTQSAAQSSADPRTGWDRDQKGLRRGGTAGVDSEAMGARAGTTGKAGAAGCPSPSLSPGVGGGGTPPPASMQRSEGRAWLCEEEELGEEGDPQPPFRTALLGCLEVLPSI